MFYHLNNDLEIFSDVPEHDFHYHLPYSNLQSSIAKHI